MVDSVIYTVASSCNSMLSGHIHGGMEPMHGMSNHD